MVIMTNDEDEYCSTCMNTAEDSKPASYYTDHKGNREWQCEDCMEGSNCFTCEFCGAGLATECVDYKPSGYREWWCLDCAEEEDRAVGKHNQGWIFDEEK